MSADAEALALIVLFLTAALLLANHHYIMHRGARRRCLGARTEHRRRTIR